MNSVVMNSVLKMSRYLPVLLIGVIFGALAVSAQVTSGTISGVVQDPSGALIAGARVTVRNVDTGAARTVTSDAEGRYIAPVLPLGNYEVRGQQAGFQTEIRSGITLTVGREEVVNLTLRVGEQTQSVTVTAEAPLVETTTSAMSSLVDDRTIRDLPLNGRSYDQLAMLQPGVVTVGAGQASAAFDFGTGTRFNVNGSRAYANTFLLDGTVINDHANATPGGAAGTNLGVDGVQEFKINTSVSPAEYGRSSGGVISAVTRSGTNSLHGSAFEFLRNNALDSPGYFDLVSHGGNGSIAPYRRNQFGGSLGGPIKKDKTFFFGTYEGLRLGNGTNISAEVPTAQTLQGILPVKIMEDSCTATPTQAFCVPVKDPKIKAIPSTSVCPTGAATCTLGVNAAVMPYLNLFQAPSPGPQADLGDGTGFFIAAPLQVTGENYFMTRVDHQISENMRIFTRYSFDQDKNVLPNFNGSAVADEHDVARRQYATIQVNNTLRPTLLNAFRFAYNRTYQNFDDVITDPRAASLSFVPGEHFGTISFGAQGLSTQPLNFLGVDNGAPRVYRYNSFQTGDDVTYVRGAHTVKIGVNIERIQDNEITSSNSRGDYTFGDIPGFLVNTPIRFDAPPPGADAYRGLRETIFGAYAQDDFKMTQRFTLNLGLRWEAISNPREVNGKMANLLNLSDPAPTVLKDSYFSVTKKDFQPRVGFAWQLNGRGTTVLRAGFGMFNDHILPYSYANFASSTPPFFTTLSDLTNPVFPLDTNLTAGPTPTQFGGFLTTNKEPSKIQYNLTLQQSVMKNTVLEVAYIGSESHHLQRNGEWNPPVPLSPGVFPAKFKQSNRINPNFASLTVARFDGNADYNALQIIVRRRSSSGLQYQVFYTYSQSIDTKSTIAGGESRQEPNTVLDFLNPGRDRGRSSFDARHNLVPTITYPFPFRFKQKALGMILGGWTVNGIGTFRTGEPFTGRVGGAGSSANGDRWVPDRPNLNPGFSNNPTHGGSAGCTVGKVTIPAGTPLGTPDLWYDPCAFSKPAAGTYGNLGRNTLTGPELFNVDFSADKVFKPSERTNVQFRAEIFNLLDQAHFYAPGFNVFSGSAGHISKVISSPGGRLVQFGLKLAF
jgi:carboxypeptidase family protein/TonB-dependent receptor-like protein